MSVSGFSVEQDPEVKMYMELRRAVLASEADRKEEQRQRRLKMGLPDVEDSRGLVSRVLRRKKRISGRATSNTSIGKVEVFDDDDNSTFNARDEVSIHEFLKSKS